MHSCGLCVQVPVCVECSHIIYRSTMSWFHISALESPGIIILDFLPVSLSRHLLPAKSISLSNYFWRFYFSSVITNSLACIRQPKMKYLDVNKVIRASEGFCSAPSDQEYRNSFYNHYAFLFVKVRASFKSRGIRGGSFPLCCHLKVKVLKIWKHPSILHVNAASLSRHDAAIHLFGFLTLQEGNLKKNPSWGNKNKYLLNCDCIFLQHTWAD